MAPVPAEPQRPKLLAQLRQALRLRHYSPRTEEAYVRWVRRYVLFHGLRHPAELGESDLTRFVSSLAVDHRVSASTQNQALAALLFLYREVLGQRVGWLDQVVHAKRSVPLPVVLTREEVRLVLGRMAGTPRLVARAPVRLGDAVIGRAAGAHQGHGLWRERDHRAWRQG